MGELKTHKISLQDAPIVLRPMTEDDWGLLLKWNSDPEVLHFAEGDDVTERSLGDVKETRAIAAGTDVVALDAWGIELLDQRPADVEFIAMAEERGLGRSDWRSVRVSEVQSG